MDFQESKEPPIQIEGRKYLTLTVSVFFALLSFFILLNVISTNNNSKSHKMAKSIKTEFNNKNLGTELILFEKRGYEQGIGNYTQSFRDVTMTFLDSVSSTISSELTETPENYIIKIKMINFFGPNDNNNRSIVINFLTYLNKFIGTIKKSDEAHANLILAYDIKSKDSLKNAQEKISNLYKITETERDKNLKFSIVPIDTDSQTAQDKLNNIYISFSKNEF